MHPYFVPHPAIPSFEERFQQFQTDGTQNPVLDGNSALLTDFHADGIPGEEHTVNHSKEEQKYITPNLYVGKYSPFDFNT